MVTSATELAFTFSRNLVKLMVSSLIPWPVRTTAKSSTATQIKTTQKINVFTFEFTKPPYRPFTSIVVTSIDATSIDAARCDRDSNTPASPDFQLADGQNPRAPDTGCNRRGGAEPASPDDGFRLGQDRPLRPP